MVMSFRFCWLTSLKDSVRPGILQRLSTSTMPFYAVAKGRTTGVYKTWNECLVQVNGFKDAKFKKFPCEQEAIEFLGSEGASSQKSTVPLQNAGLTTRDVVDNIASANSWAQGGSTEPVRSQEKTTPFYAVAVGKTPGVYRTWPECKEQIEGARYPKYRKFATAKEAQDFIAVNARSDKKPVGTIKKPAGKAPVAFFEVQSRQMSTSASGGHDFHRDEDGYIHVYTDGACGKNGRKGAKAGIGVWFGPSHPMNVSEPVKGRDTNNVAEIEAATRAIEVARSCGITKLLINTDSKFLIQCITEWLPKWQSNGWKISSGGEVKNKPQLVDLYEVKKGIDIKWNYVPGHSGIVGNEGADQLAREGANKVKESVRYKPY